MNTVLEPLQRWAFDALPVLLDVAAKGMVLLAIAGVLVLAMRKASAAARQVVWLLALAALLALPLVSAALPSWRVLPGWVKFEMPVESAEPASPPPTDSSAAELGQADPLPGAGQARTHSAPPTAATDDTFESGTSPRPSVAHEQAPRAATDATAAGSAAGQSRWTWVVPLSVAIWLAGTIVCLLPLLLGRISLWWLARHSRRITGGVWATLSQRAAQAVGLRRRVLLLQSSDETMPMVWATLRPKLLLPAEAEHWPVERRWVVLLHELAHTKRRDCLAKLVAHVACAFYWFNPLCWMAFKLMQRESEAACDDLVLSSRAREASSGGEPSSVRPSDYAEHLLEIAGGLKSGMLAAYSSIAVARKSKLEGRLLAILDATRNRRALTRIGIIIVAALIAAVAIPLAVMKATGQDEVASLIEQLKSEDEHTRELAVERLSEMGPAVAEPVSRLFAQGGHGDSAAMQVLESMAKDADVQALMRKGLDSGGFNVVHCSLIVLGKSGNRAHVAAIAPLLEKSTIAASGALSELGGDEAFEALLAALNNPNVEPRWLIVENLARFGRPEAVPEIKKALAGLTSEEFRTAHRYVEAIHKLEGSSRPGGHGFVPFHAVGDRGWRMLEGINLDKIDMVSVVPFQAKRTEQETRAAAYQALAAKKGPVLAWDQSQGNRLLAMNGLKLAPYTAPVLPKGDDLWADGKRYSDQRQLAKIVETYNADGDVPELEHGVRAYPFVADQDFLALLPDGRVGILRPKEIRARGEDVHISISVMLFDPLYKLIPPSAFAATSPQASTQPVELNYSLSSTFPVADAGITVIHVAANGNVRTGWTGLPKGELEFAEFRLEVDENHRDHLRQPQGILTSKEGKAIPVVSLIIGDVAAWIKEVGRDQKSLPHVGILLPDADLATMEEVWRALPVDGRDRWILLVPGKIAEREAISRLRKQAAEVKNTSSEPAGVQLKGPPWEVRLPNGVVVELVGLADSPSTGKAWWQPDGRPLADRPYTLRTAPFGSRTWDDRRAVELAYRVRSSGRSEGGIIRLSAQSKGSASVSKSDLGEHVSADAQLFPKDQETTDIRIGAASGPWKPIGSGVLDGKGTVQSFKLDDGYGVLEFTDPPHGANDVVFSAIMEEESWRNLNWQFIATDNTGKAHRLDVGSSIDAWVKDRPGLMRRDFHRWWETDARLVTLRLEVQPIHYAEFQNVALLPGKKTAVRVVTGIWGESPTTPPAEDPTNELMPSETLGKIVGIHGKGVAGAVVSSTNPPWSATTDSDGNFHVPAIDPGSNLRLMIRADGYAFREDLSLWRLADGTYVYDGSRKGVFELHRAGRLEGKVLGPDGQPLAAAPLSVWTKQRYSNGSIYTPNHFRAITDAEGRFVIDNVTPGFLLLKYPWDGPSNVEVTAGKWAAWTKPGEQYPSIPIKDVWSAVRIELGDGQTVKDLVLDLSQSTAAVEGQVVDRAGQPVPNAKVGLYWREKSEWSPIAPPDYYSPAVTDADGRYRLERLPAGSWHIGAWLGQGRAEPVSVELSANKTAHVDLRMAALLEEVAAPRTKPDTQPTVLGAFESLKITSSQTVFQTPPVIEIKSDGTCICQVWEVIRDEMVSVRSNFRLSEPQIQELQAGLEKSQWLKAQPSSGPPPTDTPKWTFVLSGKDQPVKATDWDWRDGPYKDLIHLARSIAHQEGLVVKLDHGGREGIEACDEIRRSLEALRGEPGRRRPYLLIDYSRYLPHTQRILDNLVGARAEDIRVALAVAVHLRLTSQVEQIATLRYDRDRQVRDDTAGALAALAGVEAIDWLVEMIGNSDRARLELLRMGESALPVVVPIIVKGSDNSSIVSVRMVRTYLRHWEQLPPPSARLIQAVRDGLENSSEFRDYYQEFLTKAAQGPAGDTSTQPGVEAEADEPTAKRMIGRVIQGAPLHVGDEVEVSVSGERPFVATVRIADDGTLTLPGMDAPVQADGKPVQNLALKIANALGLATYPENPVFVVVVDRESRKRFFCMASGPFVTGQQLRNGGKHYVVEQGEIVLLLGVKGFRFDVDGDRLTVGYDVKVPVSGRRSKLILELFDESGRLLLTDQTEVSRSGEGGSYDVQFKSGASGKGLGKQLAAARTYALWVRPSTEAGSSLPDPAEIARLIEQLASDDAAEREAAKEALVKIGEPAIEPLRVATGRASDGAYPERERLAALALTEIIKDTAENEGPLRLTVIFNRKSYLPTENIYFTFILSTSSEKDVAFGSSRMGVEMSLEVRDPDGVTQVAKDGAPHAFHISRDKPLCFTDRPQGACDIQKPGAYQIVARFTDPQHGYDVVTQPYTIRVVQPDEEEVISSREVLHRVVPTCRYELVKFTDDGRAVFLLRRQLLNLTLPKSSTIGGQRIDAEGLDKGVLVEDPVSINGAEGWKIALPEGVTLAASVARDGSGAAVVWRKIPLPPDELVFKQSGPKYSPLVVEDSNGVRYVLDGTEPAATQPANKSSVGIYLITGRPQEVPFEKVPLADFTLADEPLISEGDISEYDWESHTIHVKEQAVANRILDRKGVGDADAFVVVANGQRLYAGVMMSGISSDLPKAPIIHVGFGFEKHQPKKAIRIDPSPIAGTPDPRSDVRLKEALQTLHVLSGPDPTSASQPATQPQAFFPIVTKTLRFAPNDLRDSAISFGRERLISPSNDLNRDDKQRSSLGVDAWLDTHGLSGQLRLRWTHMRVFEAPDAVFEAATPNELRRLINTSGGCEVAAYLLPVESTGKTFAFATEAHQMGLLQVAKTGASEGRNEVTLRYKLLRRGADAEKIVATATPIEVGTPETWRWRVTCDVPVRVIEGFVIDGGKGHVYGDGGSLFRGSDVEIEVSVIRKDGEIKVVRSIGDLSAGQKETVAYPLGTRDESPVKLPEDTPLTVRHVSPAVRLTTTGLMKLWEGEFRNGDAPPRRIAFAARIETWDVPIGEEGMPFRLNDEVSSRPSTTRPAGSKLEFRVTPKSSDLSKAELASYMDWLKAGKVGFWWKGAGIRGRMPDHAWLPISGELPNSRQLVTGEHNGQKYVLVSDKPGQTMVPGEGNRGGLAKVYATKDDRDQPVIGFELDARGAELLAALTKANINNALAIVIDGKVVSAPIIKASLGKTGIIIGQFTEQEVNALVQALRAGIPPKTESKVLRTALEETLAELADLTKQETGKSPPEATKPDFVVRNMEMMKDRFPSLFMVSAREEADFEAGMFHDEDNKKKMEQSLQKLEDYEAALPLMSQFLIHKLINGTLEGAQLELAARLLSSHVDEAKAMAERADAEHPTDAAHLAFKEALDKDLSYGVGEGRTQPGAIHAWEEFLECDGRSKEQELFAMWRIASLCAYSFDSKRGEKPDMARAMEFFTKTREHIPGLVCHEMINATTQYASMPGDQMEQAMRKAEGYRWIRTRTDEMVMNSAATVSRTGSVVDLDFYRQPAFPPQVSLEEKEVLLRDGLRRGEESLVRYIAEFIEWNNDPAAAATLLNSIEDIADPAHLEMWRNTESRFHSE